MSITNGDDGVQAMSEDFPPGRPSTTEGTTAGGQGKGARRNLAIAALAVAVVFGAGVAAVWARDDGQRTSNTSAPSSNGPATTTAAPSVTATPSTTSSEIASAPATGALGEGRHPAYLTGLDVATGTIDFDLIQFLTGDEAVAAFLEDYPDDPEGWATDYYIVNDNPRLRTLPVADDVLVTVVRTDESAYEPHSITFEGLPAYFAADPIPSHDQVGHNPFWLTVRGDMVVAIEEQFLP